ncbi:MAG: hypothetical protein JRD68_02715, partial [Deltaproteobacteria bacterium]|nr:hypothetical protein [Deltaproteobacteria bacterium]
RLWKPDLKLRLLPRPGPLSLVTFLNLLEKLYSLFPGRKQADETRGAGSHPNGKNSILLIINLENPTPEKKIHAVDLIYQKTEGEMRHVSLLINRDSSEVDKHLSIIGQVFASSKPGFDDIHFFTPPGPASRIISNNLQTAFRQHAENLRRSSLPKIGTGSGLLLDTD